MTPSQMLQRRVPATECCVPPAEQYDFAAGAHLTAYACVKQKTCPICGAKGNNSHFKSPTEDLIFFYCEENDGHRFELDELAGTCARS